MTLEAHETPADNPGEIVQRQFISDEKETLRGLTGVQVVVEDLRPEVERRGLTRDQIQTDVELRLRRNKIRVLSTDESFITPGKPWLYVSVTVGPCEESLFAAFNISLELKQQVILERDQTKVPFAITWIKWGVGAESVNNLQSIRDWVKEYVDIFSNDFLAVNPKD